VTKEQRPFVLLVEDNAPLRKVIAANLDRRGYLVLEAGSFLEALDCLSIKPQLIILDTNLPDATGWDVAEWAEAASISAPIIVISGSQPDRQTMRRFAPARFLRKPFAIRQLLDLAGMYAPV